MIIFVLIRGGEKKDAGKTGFSLLPEGGGKSRGILLALQQIRILGEKKKGKNSHIPVGFRREKGGGKKSMSQASH